MLRMPAAFRAAADHSRGEHATATTVPASCRVYTNAVDGLASCPAQALGRVLAAAALAEQAADDSLKAVERCLGEPHNIVAQLESQLAFLEDLEAQEKDARAAAIQWRDAATAALNAAAAARDEAVQLHEATVAVVNVKQSGRRLRRVARAVEELVIMMQLELTQQQLELAECTTVADITALQGVAEDAVSAAISRVPNRRSELKEIAANAVARGLGELDVVAVAREAAALLAVTAETARVRTHMDSRVSALVTAAAAKLSTGESDALWRQKVNAVQSLLSANTCDLEASMAALLGAEGLAAVAACRAAELDGGDVIVRTPLDTLLRFNLIEDATAVFDGSRDTTLLDGACKMVRAFTKLCEQAGIAAPPLVDDHNAGAAGRTAAAAAATVAAAAVGGAGTASAGGSAGSGGGGGAGGGGGGSGSASGPRATASA